MPLVGHAHIGSGSARDVDAVVFRLRSAKEAHAGPDFWARAYDLMGVDDARELRERAALKPVEAARRVFVIVAAQLTVEAQNALLKVFEEPPGNALFILLVPAPSALLPTLRSRAQHLDIRSAEVGAAEAEAFLRAEPHKRLDMLKPLLQKGDDDRRELSACFAFLASLERALQPKLECTGVAEGLRILYKARSYAGDKGALMKPLLEQFAFILPILRS